MHPAILKARAVAAYGGWPAKALHKLKYDRQRERARVIAEWMREPLGHLGPVNVLVPVPLHRDRHQWRGFNQADVIAHHLAKLADLPVEHALQRPKHTDSQTRLNREQRIANMDGAMAISGGWRADPAKHYVLVDDVYTTGTTLGACAEELSKAGATKISVLAFVFDLQPRDLQAYRALVIAASP
jgi:ComF family protein